MPPSWIDWHIHGHQTQEGLEEGHHRHRLLVELGELEQIDAAEGGLHPLLLPLVEQQLDERLIDQLDLPARRVRQVVVRHRDLQLVERVADLALVEQRKRVVRHGGARVRVHRRGRLVLEGIGLTKYENIIQSLLTFLERLMHHDEGAFLCLAFKQLSINNCIFAS